MKFVRFIQGTGIGKLKSKVFSRKEKKAIKPMLLTEALVRSPAKSGNR